MLSSKNQSSRRSTESWKACKLFVKERPCFKCESPVTDSQSAHRLIRAVWDKGKLNVQEQMMAFFISFERETIAYHAAFMRTVDSTYGNPRYILQLALHTLACSVILAHNRPCGSLTPRPEEVELTKRISGALDLVEVKLIDHLIINDKTYLSMSDEGFM
jgi:DNA repair protein RadC